MGILQNGKSDWKYQTIGTYVPILCFFHSVECTHLSYKPHWRETKNAFKHYRWDWKWLEGQKKWRYSTRKLVIRAQCGTTCPSPHVPAVLSVLSVTYVVYSALSPCNGRTKLGSLSPPFSCFQVRFLVISFWWDTTAGLRGTHMHILFCLIYSS